MIVLEILTPDGVALQEDGVEFVVLRRHERSFDVGSEIAVYPRHAPMLVRIPIAAARYGKGGETVSLALRGGFAEVRHDHVVIVTPRCTRVAGEVPDPAGAARQLCDEWRAEAVGSRDELVGLPVSRAGE